MNNSNSPTCDDINSLFDEYENDDQPRQQNVLQKLQAIRLWQLKQQEELKKQQQTQLALLKSQSIEKSTLNDKENDVLAVPISNYPNHLDTILEQSAVSENDVVPLQQEIVLDATNKHNISPENDSILMGLEDNIRSVKENMPVKQLSFDTSLEDMEQLKVEDEDHIPEEIANFDSDIESSFEKVSSKQKVSFDDVPVKAGKTFDEILAEQLAQEKALKPKKQTEASTPKRSFLRKGEGIARFKGPPKKSTFKKKKESKKKVEPPISTDDIPVQIFTKISNSPQSTLSLKPKESSQASNTNNGTCSSIEFEKPISSVITETKPKPCIRKTARLSKKEPIKHLVLKPNIEMSADVDGAKCLNQESHHNHPSHDESVWSDVEDTVLKLDVTDTNDYNTTSNETFEQMEKFCYEQYADISSVKTLEEEDSIIMKKIEPLPPNKLMQELFPSLRSNNMKKAKNSPQTQNALPQKVVVNETTKHPIESMTDPIENEIKSLTTNEKSDHSAILKSKLEEMEAEIKNFQQESSKLGSVRKEEEKQLQLLKEEFEEFQRQKEDELNRLSEFKKAEIKKLKKDRKLFEDHVSATKSMPNKRDREYIQELENKISDLQSENKLKEQRLNAVNSRLRSQLETAVDENDQFKKKIKQLEDKVSKLEHEKESRKNKRSQVAWKAINDIVDAIPVNNENINIDDYIESNMKPKITPSKSPAQPLPLRNPLVNMNQNNQMNDSEVMVHDGKTEHRKKDGSVEIAFQNGTKKLVLTDGTTQIKFTNGDVKTVYTDGTVKYHYTSSGTWHTTHSNGMQVIEFSNKQIERHFPDGSKHITFEDGSSKMIKLNGFEETVFPDGTIMTVSPNGDKTIEFSNGQRETHTSEFKRREYPDGTCKTVFSDGRQETKYSSGRLRIKDADGTLLVDKVLST